MAEGGQGRRKQAGASEQRLKAVGGRDKKDDKEKELTSMVRVEGGQGRRTKEGLLGWQDANLVEGRRARGRAPVASKMGKKWGKY